MKIAETQANILMFNSMIRKNIATNDIKQFSQKQAAQCRVYLKPNPKLERVAMMNKRADLLAHIKRLRQVKDRTKRSLISLYSANDLDRIRRVISKINKNASYLKKKLKKKKLCKVEFLSVKYQLDKRREQTRSLDRCPSQVRAILGHLDIFNCEIQPEPPVGPLICHPEIKLNQCEREILNKGPKYMIRKPVTRSDFRREVEKSIAKQNYNMAFCEELDPEISFSPEEVKQTEILETESKMIFNPRNKDLSLSRLKATDFKYNKRIKLPEIEDPNLEARHQIRREEMEKTFSKLVNLTNRRKSFKSSKVNSNKARSLNSENRQKQKLKDLDFDDVSSESPKIKTLEKIQHIKEAIDNELACQHLEKKKHIVTDYGGKIDKIDNCDERCRDNNSQDKPILGKRNKETLKYECSNLTENEERGLSSLTKRINNGEIMVATSDKSGRFVVLKTEQYIRSGLKHTTQDQEIGPEELKRIQTVLNSHTKWLKNIFNIGATWGHEDRFAKNLTEGGEQACPMSCLIKDHKGWRFSDTTPDPPSRPVIAGNCGINRCLSELLSLVIEPITSRMNGDAIDSTGDMLGKIHKLNKSGMIDKLIKEGTGEEKMVKQNEMSEQQVQVQVESISNMVKRVEKLRHARIPGTVLPDIKSRLIACGLIDRINYNDPIYTNGDVPEIENIQVDPQDPGFFLVGSDVEKLFPSLQTLEAARLARMAVIDSDIEIRDVDYKFALRYML